MWQYRFGVWQACLTSFVFNYYPWWWGIKSKMDLNWISMSCTEYGSLFSKTISCTAWALTSLIIGEWNTIWINWHVILQKAFLLLKQLYLLRGRHIKSIESTKLICLLWCPILQLKGNRRCEMLWCCHHIPHSLKTTIICCNFRAETALVHNKTPLRAPVFYE